MSEELEAWLVSTHRNKHWWVHEGRWMDGDSPCVRDRGPASERDIETYNKLKGVGGE